MSAHPRSVQTSDVPGLLEAARERETQMIDRMRDLVAIESPSNDKESVDRVQTHFAAWASAAGAEIRRHAFADFGDSLELNFRAAGARRRPILLLGHLDTVWEPGTLARMPWRATRDRLSGPGVLDMKAGVVMALTAVELLRDRKLLRRPVTLLLHGDEEVGSPVSRGLTEKMARKCEAVYVLEPAQGEAGAYKTARKGVGHYRLTVTGRAAHSGVDFEKGHSAIVELARQIDALHSLTDLRQGITVNPGVVGGGTRSNVIAAEAWVEIDVRVRSRADAVRIDRALHALRAADPGCKLSMQGSVNRPPMERTPATVALFRRAQALGAQIGIALDEAATGGGSDGNFTSALGIPTLDGMGAVGAGAHAPTEYVMRKHLAARTALLAAMLL